MTNPELYHKGLDIEWVLREIYHGQSFSDYFLSFLDPEPISLLNNF